MSSVQFHRRYRENDPIPHFREQWNVHLFSAQGDQETYRVTFLVNKYNKPAFIVDLWGPQGAFVPLNTKHSYERIKRVIECLKEEFDDYKFNRKHEIK